MLKYGPTFKYPENMICGGALGESKMNMESSLVVSQNAGGQSNQSMLGKRSNMKRSEIDDNQVKENTSAQKRRCIM